MIFEESSCSLWKGNVTTVFRKERQLQSGRPLPSNHKELSQGAVLEIVQMHDG